MDCKNKESETMKIISDIMKLNREKYIHDCLTE